MSDKKPSKKVIAALERVFAAEIENRLPFQSRAKIYRDLCDEGLVQPMERKFGSGWATATVKGYALTWAGHATYCSASDDD